MEKDIVSRVRGPFFLLVVVKGLLFMLLLPPWQGPDEVQNFRVLLSFARGGPLSSLITPDESIKEMLLKSLDQHDFERLSENTFPRSAAVSMGSLSPALLWFLAIPVRNLPISDVISQLMFLRFLSFGLHLGVVWIAFKLAIQLDRESPWTALTAASIVSFHPQYSFISGAFSPDNYLVFFLSLIVYLLCRFPYVKSKILTTFALFLLAVFAFFTKRIGFIAIPLCLIGLLFTTLLVHASEDRLRIIFGIIAIVVGVVAIHFLGVYFYSPLGEWEGDVSRIATDVLRSMSLEKLTLERVFRSFSIFFVSFWFSYGWMIYKLSFGWYLLLGVMTVLGVGGAAISIMRKSSRDRLDKQTLSVSLISLSLVFTIVSIAVLFWYRPDLAYGRFLFPALVPFAVLMAMGIRESVPGAYKNTASVAAILFFIALNAVCLVKYVIPIFYL